MATDLKLDYGSAKPGPKPGLEMAPATDGDSDDPEMHGHRLILNTEEVESMNFKILAAITDRHMTFCIPSEQSIELLFFRRIFTRLQMQKAEHPSGRMTPRLVEDNDENIPIQAFQRAMGRLFYVLRDPRGFDATVYDQNRNARVGWGEFCYVWHDRQITVRLNIFERIYITLDDPQSSYLARIVSVVTLCTIVLSSLGFILSTVPEFQDKPDDGSAPKPGPAFEVIENSCLLVFVLEYLMRLCTCWAIREEVFDKAKLVELVTGYERIRLSSPVERVVRFVFNGQNLVDLAAILPGVITNLTWVFTRETGPSGGGFVVLRLIRLTRIFRAFRLGKYVEPVIVITRTVKQSTKALYVLAFNLLLGVVIFGSLMYLMEQGDWDPVTHEYLRVVDHKWNATKDDFEKVLEVSPFKSIPHAFWWALVTSTTVGYGDHYPTTSNGYVVAVVCMIWSLVILALPVGVIGGTFTKVWNEFAENKKNEADTLRREMKHVAHAIQRIQPAKVSRLLLLQIWNDNGHYHHMPEHMPVSPEDFMGEVKLELDLGEHEIRGREMRLQLQADLSVVKREITGHINVRYDWIPQFGASSGRDEAHTLKFLQGALRLEVDYASDLINTNWGNHFTSTPYVLALCYPVSPAPEEPLVPAVWRSPTANMSHPPRFMWQIAHTFDYLWYVPLDTEEYRSRACRKASHSGTLELPPRTRKASDGASSFDDSLPVLQDTLRPDEAQVMDMLLKLTTSMPQLTSSLVQIQDQVSNLSSRVDQLSTSLSGAERRPSIELLSSSAGLRGTAQGEDAASMLSMPPGHDRDQRERSDLTSSPLIDDVVQEPLNVAVLINRGHNEIGSLPGTMPDGIGG